MNQATAFLDASDIYGSTEYAVKSLRSLNGGLVTLDACSK
jgi:hypothetical protein